MKTDTYVKLKLGEKVGYSAGDFAGNLVFQLLLTYQFFFFTQIMGISAMAAGTLFLVGRFFDAITDPLMGIIADRTQSRWGRFRPWVLGSSLPFALVFWLTFTDPGWVGNAQMVYACMAYFLLMLFYTINNVPYCSLMGVMTSDVDERTTLATFRFVGMTVAQIFVLVLTWPLVGRLGGGDDSKGWSLTIAIFAVMMVVAFLITFFTTKERVEPDPEQETSPLQDIKDAFSNPAWLLLFFATLLTFIMLVVRGGSQIIFLQAWIDKDALREMVGSIGLIPEGAQLVSGGAKFLDQIGFMVKPDGSNIQNVAFAVFNVLGIISTFIGLLFSKPLSSRFGKRNTFVVCLLLTGSVTTWLFFIPADGIGLMVAQILIWGLCYGPTIPLLWSMMADVADYSEWKTGRRATAFAFAGIVFALKFGLGVGGFVQGMILSMYGYGDGTALNETAILGIRLSMTIYPALFIFAAMICFVFYPISNALNHRVAEELEERRKHFKSA